MLFQKDEFLGQLVQKRKREQEDLFSSIILASQNVHEFSDVLPTLGAWKGIVNKLVIEKSQMKSAYES